MKKGLFSRWSKDQKKEERQNLTPVYSVMNKESFNHFKALAEAEIVGILSEIKGGSSMRKEEVSLHTGIPMDFLKVFLKNLKDEGVIKQIPIKNKETGNFGGSGYRLR